MIGHPPTPAPQSIDLLAARKADQVMADRSEMTIVDGGLATELEAAGLNIQGDPLWSARILQTNPQAIKNVHASYLWHGADVITTATYQGSVVGFMKYLGLTPEEADQLLQSGVQLAKEAVAEFLAESGSVERQKPLIAGSIGPYGAFLHDGSEYSGIYVEHMSKEELKNWHRPQMHSLITAGVDLIAMETIPSQKEGEALVELLREFPNSKGWLAFSCKDEQCISHGEKFADAVKFPVDSDQLVAVGLNCCSPDVVGPVLATVEQNKRPKGGWIVYPNSGEKWNPNKGWISGPVKSKLAKLALEWKEHGAKWIGGCCRTTPAEIAELRSTLKPNLSLN